MYMHKFMFCPTSFFSNQIQSHEFEKKSVGPNMNTVHKYTSSSTSSMCVQLTPRWGFSVADYIKYSVSVVSYLRLFIFTTIFLFS